MALESATYISGLVTTNPTGSDSISQGDDHIRLIKTVLKNTFPNVASVIAPVIDITHKIDSSALRPALDDTYENSGMTVTHTKVSPTSTLYIQFDCYVNMACNFDGDTFAVITGYLGGSGTPATLITGTTTDLKMIFFDSVGEGTGVTWDSSNTFSRTFKVIAANCPDGTSGAQTFNWVYKMNDRSTTTVSNQATWMVWEVEE
jgi:hypothetical protein